jgi:hypothetical protein
LVALIPNKENKLIKTASLVPSPLMLIGIRDTIVPIDKIAKKYMNGSFIPRESAIK